MKKVVIVTVTSSGLGKAFEVGFSAVGAVRKSESVQESKPMGACYAIH